MDALPPSYEAVIESQAVVDIKADPVLMPEFQHEKDLLEAEKRAAVASENYDRAKQLKQQIENLPKKYEQIARLEERKRVAVVEEKYPLAQKLKEEIDALKAGRRRPFRVYYASRRSRKTEVNFVRDRTERREGKETREHEDRGRDERANKRGETGALGDTGALGEATELARIIELTQALPPKGQQAQNAQRGMQAQHHQSTRHWTGANVGWTAQLGHQSLAPPPIPLVLPTFSSIPQSLSPSIQTLTNNRSEAKEKSELQGDTKWWAIRNEGGRQRDDALFRDEERRRNKRRERFQNDEGEERQDTKRRRDERGESARKYHSSRAKECLRILSSGFMYQTTLPAYAY